MVEFSETSSTVSTDFADVLAAVQNTTVTPVPAGPVYTQNAAQPGSATVSALSLPEGTPEATDHEATGWDTGDGDADDTSSGSGGNGSNGGGDHGSGGAGSGQPKKRKIEQEQELIHRVVDETLERLVANDEMPLAKVYARVLSELQFAVHLENSWRRPKKGEQLQGMSDAELKLNEAKHALPQITKPKALTEISVVKILLAREHVAAINLSGGPGTNETAALAVYQRSGPEEGLYTTNEATLAKMVSRMDPAIPSKGVDSVLAALKKEALLVQKTVDPRYIPVNNGMFDYQEQALLPFTPEHVFLTKSPINYNPDAQNSTVIQPDGTPWDVESWINDLSDDEGVPELLWEVISASLRQGERFDQAVFLHSSQGNNGKGTFCAMVRNLLGPAGTTSVPMDKFSKPFALAGLVHAQAIITDENPVGAFSKDLGDFKAIVTGDQFTLERKYKDPFSVSFHGVVIQCVNDFPKSRDKSASYARRQLFIPFRKWFGGDGVERKYIKHDYLARHEVLEYVLKRALSMQHTEFSQPEACVALLAQFQRENNPVVDFWHDMADEFVWDLLPTGFLYDVFVSWFRENHPSGIVINRNDFLNHLRELLANDPQWDVSDLSTKHRPGTRMSKIEYLIDEYNLTKWMAPGYTGSDRDKKCQPQLRVNYRGIVRKPVVGSQQTTQQDVED